VAGVQYFYRVVRIQAVRQAVNTGNNGNNGNVTTRINLTPVLSNSSGVSGGATAFRR
jgi:hypothetical protein